MDFSGLVALVVGDVMLDHYIIGDASRISPEAPVPVVARKRSWTVPGGAANVARGLARLGCQARLVGLVGRDAEGGTLGKEIMAEGIKSGLVVSRNRPTTCKTRIMAHGQQLLRLDEELVLDPNLEEFVGLRLNFEKLLPESSVIILSDYGKGALLRGKNGICLCGEVIRKAAEMNIPVLVDPKGLDWGRYDGAQCVTPNTAEFQKIGQTLEHTGSAPDDVAGRRALADAICANFGIERLLLTRGARGMILYESGKRDVPIKAAMREVADVSGAGDTVIATLAACVARGLSWPDSARIANIAAGVAVGKMGTAPVSIEELNQALQEGDENPKLHSLAQLSDRIRDWRNQGQKIVFTNGCFDLLHPGHISLLRQSAALGDRLIIGLNSDASVRRLKGETRPIQTEQSRALLLSAIGFVDAITIFDEDTPENLIHSIKPDVLVKGSDYKIKNVVGADFVQSYGGHVHLVDLVDGCSTTKLESRLNRN